MVNRFKLEEANLDDKWDAFINESRDGTIFSLSDYLSSIRCPRAAYYVFNNQELRAAVSVMETDDRSSARFHDFVIYNGVLFAPPANRQNRLQIYSEHFRLASFVAAELAKRYRDVCLSLSPSIQDIRPFLWLNYGTDRSKYKTDVRYTSYVNINDFNEHTDINSQSDLYHNCSSSRRQEIRYARRKNVTTKEEYHEDLFVDFYRKTMIRQKIEVSKVVLDDMKRLIKGTYRAGLGRMFSTYTSLGDLGSMAYFVIDQKRAYFLFGANEPGLRECHTGTAVLWDAFSFLKQHGVTEVDLEGVNSPKRGWFKMSFGGHLNPYFQMILNG